MTRSVTTRTAAVLFVAVVAVGCGGGGTTGADPGGGEEPAGTEPEEAGDQATMPDVIGMPVDEAVAQLEEAGFTVGTGVVRTTEMEPDLVYRSEPAAGQQVQAGQRITLRIAAEPKA